MRNEIFRNIFTVFDYNNGGNLENRIIEKCSAIRQTSSVLLLIHIIFFEMIFVVEKV